MNLPDRAESREISERWGLTHYIGGDPTRWIPMDDDECNLANMGFPTAGNVMGALVRAHRFLKDLEANGPA